MEKETILAEYEEKIVKPAVADWIHQELTCLAEKKDFFIQLKTTLTEFMKNVAKMQDIQPLLVGEISLSFMRTSVWEGKPVLRIDAYDDHHEMGVNIACQYVEIDWFYEPFQQLEETLQQEVEKHSYERFIRTSQIHQDMSRAMKECFSVLIHAMKYELLDFDELNGYEDMAKSEVFHLAAGEYMDWQKVLFAEFPEIDLVANQNDQPMLFQKIHKKIFRNQSFVNEDLRYARFIDCEFSKCELKGLQLQDTRFINCLFRQDNFEDCCLYGAKFENCVFTNISMKDCGLLFDPFSEGSVCEEFYRDIQYQGCVRDGEIMYEDLYFQEERKEE